MDASAFLAVALACAPQVHIATAHALVSVESSFNPWAIGVVGGVLEHQPRNRAEAISTAKALQASGWSFSVGLSQINVRNLPRLGLTLERAFEPCANLGAMQAILLDCFDRAEALSAPPQMAQLVLRRALSCYYSGDFTTGYRQGYVRKVVAVCAARNPASAQGPAKEKRS